MLDDHDETRYGPGQKLNDRRSKGFYRESDTLSANQTDSTSGYARTSLRAEFLPRNRLSRQRGERRNRVRCWAQCDLRDLIWIMLLVCAGGSGLSAGVFYMFIQHEHPVARRTAIMGSSMAYRNRDAAARFDSRFSSINVPTNATALSTSSVISIFYNVFDGSNPFGFSATDPQSIIREQLDQVASSFASTALPKVYYTTIGQSNDDLMDICLALGLTCLHLQHFPVASETATLSRVHEYCNKFPSHSVVYLHNKGSLHRSRSQDSWRQALTASATSIDCLQRSFQAPLKCNTCGLLFQPLPASHFPGNMWSATCQYVQQLLPPNEYHARRPAVDEWIERERNTFLFRPESHFIGKKRYEAEHWIGSHPSLRPCDVSVSPNLEAWTMEVSSKPAMKLGQAPRIAITDPRWVYFKYMYRNETLHETNLRLRDYFLLRGIVYRWMVFYNRVADQDSWVWAWYPDGSQWRRAITTSDDPMQAIEDMVNATGSASIIMPVPTMAQKILQAGSAALDWMQPWSSSPGIIYEPF